MWPLHADRRRARYKRATAVVLLLTASDGDNGHDRVHDINSRRRSSAVDHAQRSALQLCIQRDGQLGVRLRRAGPSALASLVLYT